MKLNIPIGLKLFGANIVPTAANVAVDSGLQAWSQMILTWNWSGWVQPQVDYLVGNGIGVNCIRLIGANFSVMAGRFTQAFYDAKILQLANYLNSLGVYFYACCDGDSRDTQYAGSSSAIADCFATTLLKLQALPNVIGVDVIQEFNSAGWAATDAAALIQLLKNRGVTLPMTCSSIEGFSSGSGGPYANAGAAAGFDFIDEHVYYSTMNTVPYNAFDYFRANWPTKDILIGEFGTGQDATGLSIEQSWTPQALNLANHADPAIRGCLMWACTDQDTVASNQLGVFDGNFNIRQSKANILRRYTGGSLAKSLALHR